jgi:hypothetical protein
VIVTHVDPEAACKFTTRPARTGVNVNVAVAGWPTINEDGIDNPAVCLTTPNVLAAVTY